MRLSGYLVAALRSTFARWYRVEGRNYLWGPDEDRTGALLRRLEARRESAERLDWLLPLRDVVREVEALAARACLTQEIGRARGPAQRRLAIWLRGRCGGYLGQKTIASFAADPEEATRKEVARALQRLSAWPALRKMAANDPSPRVRAIAQSPPLANSSRSRSQFLNLVEYRPCPPAHRPFLLAPGVDLRQGRPARSPWLIRQVLLRIRALMLGA